MSRSYKKSGWCKDGAARSNSGPHFFKRKANKAIRRFDDEIPPKGKFFRKVTNSWNIHDFILPSRKKGSCPNAFHDWMK